MGNRQCGRRVAMLGLGGLGLGLGAFALPYADAATITRSVPREVLAFYYGWYGNPRVSGHWVHWKPEADGKAASNITDTPLDGLYDSHDPAEVARQVAEAKQAGITGFVADWWGVHDFTDRSMPVLLAAARPTELKVTAILDGKLAGADEAARKAQAISQLHYLLHQYGGDPAWLRVGGKPVLFVYGGVGIQLPLPAWREVLAQVRAKAPHGLVAIGPSYDPKWLAVFDGAHQYNIAGAIHSLSLPKVAHWAREYYGEQVEIANSAGKISCVTVIPGYDDSHTGRPPPRPVTARDGGRTYAVLWQAAVAAHPDWILITTWNEWHEGSEIEPSERYRYKDLRQTSEFATKFLRFGSQHVRGSHS